MKKFLEAKPDPATEARFREHNFKMIAVGRFVDKEKNFSMLIEMMRDFVHPVRNPPSFGVAAATLGRLISNGVKICPRALLVLVGDGPDKESYKLQAKAYNLENNVIIEPWRDDLPSFYKSFDLFLLSSNYEGWGRVVIEAMAAGLPVVVTDVGLAGEVVKNGENGIVVPVGNRAAMLHAVTKLFNDNRYRKRLSAAGLETVKNLEPKTKEEYLRKYEASYCNPKSR